MYVYVYSVYVMFLWALLLDTNKWMDGRMDKDLEPIKLKCSYFYYATRLTSYQYVN